MLMVFFCGSGDVGSVYFGPNHPMKPHRLCMTHHLILAYGLHSKMEVYVSVFLLMFLVLNLLFLLFTISLYISFELFIFLYCFSVHTRHILLRWLSSILPTMWSSCNELILKIRTCFPMKWLDVSFVS